MKFKRLGLFFAAFSTVLMLMTLTAVSVSAATVLTSANIGDELIAGEYELGENISGSMNEDCIFYTTENVVLDLKGFSITNTEAGNAFWLEYGSLTLNDSVGTGQVNAGWNAIYALNGTVTINGGIYGNSGSARGIFAEGSSVINIAGGTVCSTSGDGIQAWHSTEINVTGGSVYTGNQYASAISAQSGTTVNVSGGSVYNTAAGSSANSSHAIYASSATVTVSGSAKVYNEKANGIGIDATGSAVTVSGNAKVFANKETYPNPTTGQTSSGIGIKASGGTVTVSGGQVFATGGSGKGISASDGTVIQVSGGTVYANKAEGDTSSSNTSTGMAIDASGGSVTVTSGTVYSTGTRSTAINGTNSCSITVSGGTVYSKTGNNNSNYAAIATSGGTVTVNGTGTVYCTGSSGKGIYATNSAVVNVSGGTVYADYISYNNSISGKGIEATSGSTVNISGTAVVHGSKNAIYSSGSTVCISGGSVYTQGTYASNYTKPTTADAIEATGSLSVTVSGGSVTASLGNGITAVGTTIAVSGGTVSSTAASGDGIKADGGSVTVSQTGNVSGTQYGIHGVDSPTSSAVAITVSGGTVDSIYTTGGSVTQTGGTITESVSVDNNTTVSGVTSYGVRGATYSSTISSAADLKQLAEYINGGGDQTNMSITLQNDITVTSSDYVMIGTNLCPFTGTFNGNNKTINITGSSTGDAGLFGYVSGGTITNLTVAGSISGGTAASGEYHVAGVIAKFMGGTLNNITNSASVTGGQSAKYVGGVIGETAIPNTYAGDAALSVSNLTNSGVVRATPALDNNYIGGVVGCTVDGRGADSNWFTYSNCTNSGTISCSGASTTYAGGLTGYSQYCRFVGCSSTGHSVLGGGTSASYVGGLVGYADNTEISKCEFKPVDIAGGTGVSGEEGYLQATTGSTKSYAGGLVAYANSNVVAYDCDSTGNVILTSGQNSTDGMYAGGLAGYMAAADDYIFNCYNTGRVYHSSYASAALLGGLAGRPSGEGNILNCYYQENPANSGNGGTNNTYGDANGATAVTPNTAEDFGNGKVAHDLQQVSSALSTLVSTINESRTYNDIPNDYSTDWGQTIGTNELPILVAENTATPVYQATFNGTTTQYAYANAGGTFTQASLPAGAAHWSETPNGTAYNFAATVSGDITLYAVTTTYFVGHSLSLNGSIDVNFYINLGGYSNDNAKVVMSWYKYNIEVPLADVTPATINGLTCYKVTCPVAAKEMADTITAVLYVNDVEIVRETYSVAEYANAILAETEGDEESYLNRDEYINKTNTALLRTLVTNMLIYGAKSQTYFGHNTENLADAGLPQYDLAILDKSTFSDYGNSYRTTRDNAMLGLPKFGLSDAGSELILKTNTGYRVYFNITDGGKFDGVTVTYGGEPLTQGAEGEYIYYDITGIHARDIDKNITLTFTQSGGSERSLTFNPQEYMYSVLSDDSASDALKATISALYRYNQAAIDYFTE